MATLIKTRAAQECSWQAADTDAIHPCHVNFPKRNSPNCAGVSERQGGLTWKRARITRKPYRSRRFRNSHAIGRRMVSCLPSGQETSRSQPYGCRQ
jgi:hypothetical protein